MKMIRVGLNVVGRFLVSLVFLVGGVHKIFHWHENERLLMHTLCEWQSNIGFSDALSDCLAAMIPLSPLLLLAAGLAELFGGISLLVGFKEKLGAALLILFLIPSTIMMHPFWFAEGTAKEVELIHFLKNLAILGGVILFAFSDPQPSKNPFPKSLY